VEEKHERGFGGIGYRQAEEKRYGDAAGGFERLLNLLPGRGIFGVKGCGAEKAGDSEEVKGFHSPYLSEAVNGGKGKGVAGMVFSPILPHAVGISREFRYLILSCLSLTSTRALREGR
jgi:hypothetical protein